MIEYPPENITREEILHLFDNKDKEKDYSLDKRLYDLKIWREFSAHSKIIFD